MVRVRAATMLILGLIAGSVGATDGGDPAAGLSVSQWVHGEAVDVTQGTNVYVVDFWATWSPVCNTSVRKLSLLQKNFRRMGLTIVGVTDERGGTVKAFLDGLGEELEYSIGLDEDRKTSRAYLDSFAEGGIPQTFVINREGRVVWHGHPLHGLDRVVLQVLLGKFDEDAARKQSKWYKRAYEYLEKARKEEGSPALEELGRTAIREAEERAAVLNHFAWRILTDKGLKTRDVKLALSAARAAKDQAKGDAPAILDTYAKALYANGKLKLAVQAQEEALDAAKDERLRKRFEATLAEYRQKAEAAKDK